MLFTTVFIFLRTGKNQIKNILLVLKTDYGELLDIRDLIIVILYHQCLASWHRGIYNCWSNE